MSKKKAFEEAEAAFKAQKKAFYRYVDEHTGGGAEKRVEVPDLAQTGAYCLARVQRVKISWDADRTEEALKNADKTLASEIVQRDYTLADKRGFIEYAKSLGAEPKKMLSFFAITRRVDEKALNRLTELGEIDEKLLAGCYDIETGDPYWTVKFRGKPAESDKTEV